MTTNGTRIGYARVSTAGQDLAAQTDQLTNAGVDDGSIYAEHVTGTRADRPELRSAIKALRPGDTFVVTKLDRLARSLKDLLTLIEEIEARGATLHVIDQAIDTGTAAGRMMVAMIGAVAEFEAALASERTKAGLASRTARGRMGGRPTVMTQERARRAQELIETGSSREETAGAIGVSTPTLYRWLQDNPIESNIDRTGMGGRRAAFDTAEKLAEAQKIRDMPGVTASQRARLAGVSVSTLWRHTTCPDEADDGDG